MDDRVVLVTGAASGIGLATAECLLAGGWQVVLADVDGEGAERRRHELDPGGHRSLARGADVTDATSIQELVEAVEERHGRLDALVNNAGRPSSQDVDGMRDEDWAAALDVNLSGTLRCSRAALPLLRRSAAPAVVNMASVAAFVGMPGRAAYGAAKAGVVGLTRVLAIEWAGLGVRVNAVAPGYVRTAGFDERVGVRRGDELSRQVPLGRLCRPDEVATVIRFLVSTEASYVTGHTITIDGGLTVRGSG